MALLAIALVASTWPYLPILHWWPQTTDGALWISRGAFTNPHWLDWDCCKPHFVFYRPVVAFSYSLSYALGGFDPFAYRVTDVLVHVATGLLVAVLYRELDRSGARWGAATAAAVFLLHPVSEEVVPLLARRGYGLMTLFGVVSVIAFVRACRRDRIVSLPALASALAIAASVLSTEVGFVLAPMYPILALHLTTARGRHWTRPLAISALPLVTAAGIYALRLFIVGDHGGYQVATGWEKLVAIVRESWHYLLFPSSASGAPGWVPLGVLGWLLVVGYYGWRTAIRPLVRIRSQAARLPLVLLVWIAGYTALPALFGVWFYRQAYPAMVPLALLVATVFGDTLRSGAGRPAWRALHLVPQALLLASLLTHSPALRGLDPDLTRARRDQHARMVALHRDLERVREPAVVYLVLSRVTLLRTHPFWSANVNWQMSLTRYWMAAMNGKREIRFRNLAQVELPSVPGGGAPVAVVHRGGRQALVFSPGANVQFPGVRSLLLLQPDLDRRTLWLDQLPVDDGVHGYVYYYAGENGILVPIRPREEVERYATSTQARRSPHRARTARASPASLRRPGSRRTVANAASRAAEIK